MKDNMGRDVSDESIQQTYSNKFYQRCPIWLSSTFSGFFLVPDNQIWNYNFIGIKLENIPVESIGFSPEIPKSFYNQVHRISHFVNFCKHNRTIEETEEGEDADRNDEVFN